MLPAALAVIAATVATAVPYDGPHLPPRDIFEGVGFDLEEWEHVGADAGVREMGRREWRLFAVDRHDDKTIFRATKGADGGLELERGIPWGIPGAVVVYIGRGATELQRAGSTMELLSPGGDSSGRQHWLGGFTANEGRPLTHHLVLSFDTAGTNGADANGGPGGPGNFSGASIVGGLKLFSQQGLISEDLIDGRDGGDAFPREYLLLTEEEPKLGHEYAGDLGYNRESGLVWVRVRDETEGQGYVAAPRSAPDPSIVYEGTFRIEPHDGELRPFTGGFNGFANWASDKMWAVRLHEVRLGRLSGFEPHSSGLLAKDMRLQPDRRLYRRGDTVRLTVTAPRRPLEGTLLIRAEGPITVPGLYGGAVPQEDLTLELPTAAWLPGVYELQASAQVKMLEPVAKAFTSTATTVEVLEDGEFLSRSAEWRFRKRRAFRSSEDIEARLLCKAGEGIPVSVTLHPASLPTVEWLELEKVAKRRELRAGEDVRLEELRVMQLRGSPALKVLHEGDLPETGAPVSIEAGVLPPGTYELRAQVEGGAPVREIVTILPETNWRDTLVTALNCYILTDIPAIHNLVDAGVNAVQVHARPEDTEYMDRMAAHGIRVISGATMLPPIPEGAAPMNHNGDVGGRQFYSVCYNHPDLPELIEKQAHETLAKVAEHPSVLAYWTINEVADHDGVCYCEHCAAAFRDQVGRDVEPPRPPSIDPDANGYVWHDWVRFRDASMRRFLKTAIDATREVDPERPVGNKGIIHYHFAHNLRSPWYELAPDGDLFWYSSYVARWAGVGNYAEIATSLGKPAWVSEFNHLSAPAGERGAACFSGFMHGLTGLVWFCYQPYREGDAYFGLMEEDWTRGDRYEAVAKAFSAARKVAPVLTQAELVRRPIGVIFSDTTMLHATGEGEAGELEREFVGTVEALQRMKLGSYALVDYQVGKTDLSRFSVLVLPGAKCVPPDMVEPLRMWMERGGTLIADAGAGLYDHGKQERQVLRELLGVEQVGLETAPATYEYNGEEVAVELQPARALEGTAVLLSDAKGRPVVTRRGHEAGGAYFLAFRMGEACFRQETMTPAMEMLRFWGGQSAGGPHIRVTRGLDDACMDVDAVVRRLPEGGVTYVLAVNYGGAGGIQLQPLWATGRVIDLLSGEEVGRVEHPRAVGDFQDSFTVHMERWQPRAFAIWDGTPVTHGSRRTDAGYEVTLDGQAGTMVTVQLRDANGLTGEAVRTLIRPGRTITLPVYRIMQEPLSISVGTW